MNPIRKVRYTAPTTSHATASGRTWSGSQNRTSKKKTKPTAAFSAPTARSIPPMRPPSSTAGAGSTAAGVSGWSGGRLVAPGEVPLPSSAGGAPGCCSCAVAVPGACAAVGVGAAARHATSPSQGISVASLMMWVSEEKGEYPRRT